MDRKEIEQKLDEYCEMIKGCEGCKLEHLNYCLEGLSRMSDDQIKKLYTIVFGKTDSQETVKQIAGKPRLTLVPLQIIWDIAETRMYGLEKYPDAENWRKVPIEQFRDAAFRHFLAYLADPQGVDPESGIEHYKHWAFNVACICEKEKEIKNALGSNS